MTTIIQDFKDWRNTCDIVERAYATLDEYRRNFLTRYISVEEMKSVLKNQYTFRASLPKDETQPDYKEIFQEVTKRFRSEKCFYKPLDGRFMTPIACINMNYSKRTKEFACNGCVYVDNRKKYDDLLEQVIELKKQQEIAKQKLLDNFRFWKQQTK